MDRLLVTGAEGFTGRYLLPLLSRAGYEVHALARHKPSDDLLGVSQLHLCDLTNSDELADIIGQVKPSKVAHLAAISSVDHGSVDQIYSTNVVATRHLLEALANTSPAPSAVLLASSANIYGNRTSGTIDERTPPAPANDYAVSKLAMEFVAKLYDGRLPITIVRPFNYTGRGQSTNFLIPKIVERFRQKADFIELGNLDVARDFSDVRVLAEAYKRLLDTPKAIGGVFNFCSGRVYTLTDILKIMGNISGQDIEVRVNPAFVRANEVKILQGSNKMLEATIGPLRSPALDETLRWMLEA